MSDPIDTPEQILEKYGEYYHIRYINKYTDDMMQHEFPNELNRHDALEALESYYHSQTEKVLREVIGEDRVCLNCRDNTELSHKGGNFIGSCPVDEENEYRAEQRQRAADKGFNLKEEAE